jgi:P-type E1-E2 ATPase
MINIDIPGFGSLQLSHLVLDYNGTLAVDGKLLPGVGSALTLLSSKLEVHVITADTFGIAASQLATLPVNLTIVPNEAQAETKLQFVAQLGADNVVAIGNGRNDRMMLKAAAVGIAVVQAEGSSAATLASADVATSTILDALDLLQNPKRLIATLRS